MAPLRKPQVLKDLAGTARPDRALPEPAFPAWGEPEAPSWVRDREALEWWEELTSTLVPLGVVTALDRMALAHLVSLHAVVVRSWRAGVTPPASMVTQLRLLMGEFGLTPSTRPNVGQVAPPVEMADSFGFLSVG